MIIQQRWYDVCKNTREIKLNVYPSNGLVKCENENEIINSKPCKIYQQHKEQQRST